MNIPINNNGQATMANSSPVTLASDSTDVKITLDSEAVVLGAGSATIGKIAANSGVDIGDVDVLSLPAITGTVTANAGTNLNTSALALDATLTNATQKTKIVDSAGVNAAAIDANGALAIQAGGATGAAVPARAIQVAGSDGTNLRAIKTSATGVVSVDGSAVTQPVSGTITAVTTVGTITNVVHVDDNAGSLTVDAPVATPVFVRLSDGAAAIATLPVSLATNTPTLQSGSTTAVTQATAANLNATVVGTGTFAVQSAATLTAETTKVIGSVRMMDTLGQSTNSVGTGFLLTSDEARQVFYDSFDAALDTTNMWTSTTGSSGVAAAVSLGELSMGTGTTANGYSKLTTIPTFKPTIPGWIQFSDAIKIPDAAAPTANALRFWGVGTTPATPSTTTPITDGYFFELSTAGVLSAVVYAGGTRTVIATGLTLATTYQRYIIKVRTDRTFFFIGTIDSAGLVATTSFQSPQAQILPKLYLAVGNSTPPVSNSQILSTGAVVSDTGKNSTTLSDGAMPWRKATVKAASTAAAATDLPLVVALHPTSPLPAGTAIIGALVANQSVNVAQFGGTTVVNGGVAGVQAIGGNVANAVTATSNPVPVGGIYTTTPATLTTGQTATLQFNSVQNAKVTLSGKLTYRASAAAVLVPAVTADKPWLVIYGSSTKTIKVQRIIISGLTLTAVQYLNIGVAKYSTAPSGGTATTFVQIPLNSTSAAATASLVQGYTTVPTTGTRIGFIRSTRVLGQATVAAAAGTTDEYVFDFRCVSENDAVALNGTAQGIGLEWIATVPASTVSMMVDIEWIEES